MRKSVSARAWHLLFVVTIVCMVPVRAIAQSYDQQLQAVCKSLSARLIAQGKTTAAVVDFTDLSGSVTALGRFLAEELSGCLVSVTTELQVVERLRLSTVLKEQKLAESPIFDPATAKKLGEIVGAQAILTGTLTPFGDSVRLSVRALDVATARVVGAATAEIPKTRAIEELLTKDSAGNAEPKDPRSTVGTPVAESSGSGAPASRASPLIQKQTVGGINWQLMECKRDRTWVVCRFMVSHNQNAEVTLRVSRAIAMDDQRNDATYFPGIGQFGQSLLPGSTEFLPISFETGARNRLSENATALVSLQIQFYLGSERQPRLVRFEQVRIQ